MSTRDMSVAETLGALAEAFRDAITERDAALAEVDRLKAAERERDALRAAVDRHVSESVYQSFGYWCTNRWTGHHNTRAEAEAAYREATGLEVPIPASATEVRDADGSPA